MPGFESRVLFRTAASFARVVHRIEFVGRREYTYR